MIEQRAPCGQGKPDYVSTNICTICYYYICIDIYVYVFVKVVC